MGVSAETATPMPPSPSTSVAPLRASTAGEAEGPKVEMDRGRPLAPTRRLLPCMVKRAGSPHGGEEGWEEEEE